MHRKKGLKQKDILLAESIIEENQLIFLKRWNEFFKKLRIGFFDYKVAEVWFAEKRGWIKLADGTTAAAPLQQYPLLAAATPQQLENFEIVDGYALHWPELDEDLSIAGFFQNENETGKGNTNKAIQVV